MKTAKTAAICGMTSLALAAAGLAGCGDKAVDGTQAALIINDEEINLGTASFYLRHQQAETENMMVSYGFGTSGSMWGTGLNEGDYGLEFKDSMTDSLTEMVLQRQHAEGSTGYPSAKRSSRRSRRRRRLSRTAIRRLWSVWALRRRMWPRYWSCIPIRPRCGIPW